MEQVNYSIVGDEVQKMSILNKIGIGIFTIGVYIIVSGSFGKKSLSKVENAEWYLYGSFFLMAVGVLLFLRRENQGLWSNPMRVFAKYNLTQKIGLCLSGLGLGLLGAAWLGLKLEPATLFLWLSLGTMAGGILLFSYGSYAHHPAGIKNNDVFKNQLTNQGLWGWIAGIVITVFYIQLYWFSDSLEGMIRLFDPLAFLITGKAASQWFVYGTIYTFIIFFLGIKFIIKYRHNRYQLWRTISMIFFQLVFAYFVPHIMEAFVETQGYFQKDLKNVWPLNYGFVESYQLNAMRDSGVSGTFFFFWGIILFLVVTPFLTYLVGKRWYCSWVCGCGGLAETAGDGFRQLSSKKEIAWKIERWVVHLVMVFVATMTVAVLWPYFSGKEYVIGGLSIDRTSYFVFILVVLLAFAGFFFWRGIKFKNRRLLIGGGITVVVAIALILAYSFGWKEVFSIKSKSLKKAYGFMIGAAFSGVIGVGFYPMLGNRVWCRFGCPMAGYMGLFQRFKSRFRITTNGGQCISCGNCSTYCEQGIDVRAYAQKGENIVRSSCVGCGICSAVCPRGVLKLENGPEEGRFEGNPIVVDKDGVRLNGF